MSDIFIAYLSSEKTRIYELETSSLLFSIALSFFSDPLRRHTHTNTLQIRITLCQTCWVAVYLVLDPVQFPLFVSLRCLRKILRPDISQAFSVVTSEIDESDRGLLATFFFLHFRP
jgi:tellurite resistance protein TehA-like permease